MNNLKKRLILDVFFIKNPINIIQWESDGPIDPEGCTVWLGLSEVDGGSETEGKREIDGWFEIVGVVDKVGTWDNVGCVDKVGKSETVGPSEIVGRLSLVGESDEEVLLLKKQVIAAYRDILRSQRGFRG